VTALPKTNETTEWLQRRLVERASFRRPPDEESTLNFFGSRRVKRRDFNDAVFEDAERRKGAAWVIGTSLAFEAVMLGGCAWIFRRRDF